MKVLQSLGIAFHFYRLPAGPLGQKISSWRRCRFAQKPFIMATFFSSEGDFFLYKGAGAKGIGRKGNPLNGLYAFQRYFTSP